MTLLVRFRNALLRASIPLQRLMQKIGKPEPLINDQQYLEFKAKLEDGDVLLSRENWRLTSLFIPGFWCHAAFYMDGFVYEAVGKGVQKVLIERWILSKDHIALLKPNFYTNKQSMYKFLEAQVGLQYDYEFGGDQKAWYCSELCYATLQVGNPEMPIQLRETLGVETVTPQDFENMVEKEKFILKYEAINK